PTTETATDEAPPEAPAEPDAFAIAPMSASPGGTAIRRDNTFYAYVETGDNLDVSFVKWLDHAAATDLTVTVRGPGGVLETCTRLATDPIGASCAWTDLTAATTGIWQIDFAPA